MTSGAWSARRIGGIAGIGFAILVVVLFLIGGDSPTFDDSAEKVREFFVDSDTTVHVTTWLGALTFVFFLLPFAAGLRTVLGAADPVEGQMLSRISYSAAVIAVAVGGAGSAYWEVLSQGVAEDLSDDTLVALARFDTVSFAAVLPWALALFVFSASVVIVQSGVVGRWIGWLGILAALLLVVGTLWIFTEDDESALAILVFVGLPLTVLWVLILSISMLRTPTRASASTPSPAPAA